MKNSLESNKTQQIKLSIQLQELEQKQKELATLEGIKNEFEQLQPQLLEQQKLKEIELKKDGLNKEQIQLRAQYKKVQETIASLEAGVKNFNNLQAKHQQIKNEIEKLQTSIKELENQIKTINSSISGEQKVIDISKSQIAQIQKIGKGSNCPTCTRPLLEEYDRVIDNLSSTVLLIQKEKIDKLNLELSKFENSKGVSERQKEELNKQVQELSKEIAVIETKQKDLLAANTHCKEVKDKGIENKNELEKLLEFTYDENYHKNLVQKEQILRPKYESYKTLQTIIQRVPSVQKELDEIVKAVQEQSRAFANKELDIKAVVYDETNHKVKIEEFTSLQKQKDELLSAINNLKVQISQLDGEVKTIQTALDANNKHQEKLLKKQQDLMDYEKIKLSLSEFKTKLNSKIAPRISQIASHMYSQITKGKYQHIEADNDFDFYIYDDGKRFPIERFSGGEIDLANLVLRIAISKTLGELNGSANIGFLAFDEIFGSQDDSRRMEILEAFHTIKEQYRQIFLISHEMEIKEMFERVVEV